MTSRCHENFSATAVDIACHVTKCTFSSADRVKHVAEIINNRPSSLYNLEICSITFNNNVGFGSTNLNKSVIIGGIVSTRSSGGSAKIVSVGLTHRGSQATEEIQTTIEFHDATQRTGGMTFVGPKETHSLSYEFDLV